ncbi:MAG: flagellar biosynthesis anti-sigma factor FlgM [Bacillota bacterium]
MKVNTDYTQMIRRVLGSEKRQAGENAQAPAPANEDRQEISRAMTALQRELQRIEAESSPARAARLRQLAEEIARGDYRVDDERLAAAMLDFSEKL